jgi:hypothetical protein
MRSSRALPLIESTESPVAGWTRSEDDDRVFLWPRADEIIVRAAWRAGDVPVALVHDDRIMRDYLVADGAAGVALMSSLVHERVVEDPAELISSARAASGWGALGDTLYDVIAGCVDPYGDDVAEVWLSRAADPHPLIRLAAAWTGPYLPVDPVRSQIENLASGDPEGDVRAAARESLDVLERIV